MFRFTWKPSSRSYSQYLADITHSVQCEYVEVVQTSVLWLHSMTCEACAVHCVSVYAHSAQHTCLTGHTMQP
jgi:hypothetical protein